jgi:OOP family OmpA-OmpF porin
MLLPLYAFAGDWYIGAGFGSSKSADATSNVDSGFGALATLGVSTNLSYHDKGRAFSVLGGYRVNPNIAVEAAYDYLGTYQLNAAFSGMITGTGSEEDKVSAFSLSGIGSLPITPALSVYGRLGMAVSNVDMTCSISVGPCTSKSSSKTGPLIGIGASIVSGQNANLRLEYDHFQDVGDSDYDYVAGPFSLIKLEALFYL